MDPKGPRFCTLSPCHGSIWWDFKRPPWRTRGIYRKPYRKSSIKQKQSSWETPGAELKVIINLERGFEDTFHLENCTLGRLCLVNHDYNSCRVQSRCCLISGDFIYKESNEPHQFLVKKDKKRQDCLHWLYVLNHVGNS